MNRTFLNLNLDSPVSLFFNFFLLIDFREREKYLCVVPLIYAFNGGLYYCMTLTRDRTQNLGIMG